MKRTICSVGAALLAVAAAPAIADEALATGALIFNVDALGMKVGLEMGARP